MLKGRQSAGDLMAVMVRPFSDYCKRDLIFPFFTSALAWTWQRCRTCSTYTSTARRRKACTGESYTRQTGS